MPLEGTSLGNLSQLYTPLEGIRLLMAPATGGKPQYGDRWPDVDTTLGFHCFTVADDGLDIEFIPLDQVSDAEGYGPRGHVHRRRQPAASLRQPQESAGIQNHGGGSAGLVWCLAA